MFPNGQIQVIYIYQKNHRSDDVLFSVHSIRWHVMLICPISGDVNFCCLVKMVSTKLYTLRLMNNCFVLINE